MLSVIQPPARDSLVGALLDGRYHVTGVLGRGGTGIVYEALQQPLGRAVAIKVLGPNTASDPVVVARFLCEARVASGLAHGNIVDVSDLGRLPDGRPYLVMPKVAGIDFATLLEREGPMPPARVASLLHGVAAALDLVHAKGMVHRDVKPENLMHVLRADGSETVMLLDFGIAALLASNAVQPSGDGLICGSPAYMAPELIASDKFDRRADVYALATVAFEMLAGRLPFNDELPMRVMMVKTVSTAPTLKSVVSRSFPDEVERVIARGLVREPAARYASAGEFVTALARAAHGGARSTDLGGKQAGLGADEGYDRARLDSTRPTETVVLPLRSQRLVSLSAVLVLTVGLVLFAWRLVSHDGSVADTAARGSAPTAAAAHGMPAPRETGVYGDSVAVAALPTPAIETPAAPIAVEQAVLPQAVPAAHVARPVATRVASASGTARSEALTAAANRDLLQGHLARAVELFQRAIARDPRDLAALRGLALAQEHLGHNEDAARAYRKALALEPDASLASQLRERLGKLETGYRQ